ncbi:hypothetical protein AB0O01_25140 [Streptomyces sp. NPDC093252]|uniref:hypothetical protein n=1 Tax=Streptomyces sp. NPDC093252 TaxID=3154980 RepID=UPI00342711A4
MTDPPKPLALHMPLLQPAPVEGCAVCGAAATARDSARRLGSAVSERAADETIRQHPHRRATDQTANGDGDSQTLARLRELVREDNRKRREGGRPL